MPAISDYEASWYSDGHIVGLYLNKNEVEVRLIKCPHDKRDGPCAVREVPCVVEYFVDTFGLEGNVGTAEARPEMEIAWTLLGDSYDLNACQMWWIPAEDTAFASWLSSRG